MKAQRNWVKGIVFVVLALASLSSTAMSVPHRDRVEYLADLCGVTFVNQFDQYLSAIEWAERGGPVPLALTVSCVDGDLDIPSSFVDRGGESGVRWEQYMAAIEGRELTLDAAPTRFGQYSAAIEWAERGGPVPLVLTVSYSEEDLKISTLFGDQGGDSWTRFEQYMAAIER